jgi:hypothetical protein
MLDVIHVLFEEDVTPLAEGHLEAKSAMRVSVYQNLYGREYKYPITTSNGSSSTMSSDFGNPANLPPDQLPVKQYIPPTNPEDLPGILDAPLA